MYHNSFSLDLNRIRHPVEVGRDEVRATLALVGPAGLPLRVSRFPRCAFSVPDMGHKRRARSLHTSWVISTGGHKRFYALFVEPRVRTFVRLGDRPDPGESARTPKADGANLERAVGRDHGRKSR